MAPLEFQVVDWRDYHSLDADNREQYVIQMFGRTECGKSVYLWIDDFHPHFFIRIPKFATNDQVGGLRDELTRRVSNRFKNHGGSDLSKSLLRSQIVLRRNFYHFDGGKQRKYLMLTFDSYNALKSYVSATKYEVKVGGVPTKLVCYESKLQPYLRLIHKQNLLPCGWVSVDLDHEHTRKTSKYSRCDLSYRVSWKAVTRAVHQDRIAPLLMLGYDIEAVSQDALFPTGDRPGDKVIQIALTSYPVGSMDCQASYLLNLGPCNPITGTRVTTYSSERKLLLGWADHLNQIGPDAILGHNIFNFDDRFLYARIIFLDKETARKKGVEVEDLEETLLSKILTRLGRVRNEVLIQKAGLVEPLTVYKPLKLSSSALGVNEFTQFSIPGIVSIDTLFVIKTAHKLKQYSLDACAAEFISEPILSAKITGKRNRQKYVPVTISTTGVRALEVESFVQLIFVKTYYDVVYQESKYRVIEVDPVAKTLTILMREVEVEGLQEMIAAPEYVGKWAFAKDEIDFKTMTQYFREGNAEGMAEVGKYCVQDCKLVNLLVAKLDILLASISMGNVCLVPLSYLFSRGQGIKTYSLVVEKCSRLGFVVENLEEELTNDCYRGAIVLDPVVGIYEQPVCIPDFEALYPTSMIQAGLSHEGHVKNKKYLGLKDYHYHQFRFERLNEDGKIMRDDNGEIIYDECTFAQKRATKRDIRERVGDQIAVIDQILADRLAELVSGYRLLESDLKVLSITASPEYQEGSRAKRSDRKLLAQRADRDREDEYQHIMRPHFNRVNGVWHCHGIIGSILAGLLDSRRKVKNLMGRATDPFLKAVYNYQQLALKITCNNTYGQTGARTSMVRLKPIAKVTTFLGRTHLESAKRIVEETFPDSRVIYGDTDSLFIIFNLKDADGNLRTGKEVLPDAFRLLGEAVVAINKQMPPPQKIVAEKVFLPFILVSAKKYCGMKYEWHGDKGKIDAMGMVLKRRDNAPIVKLIVGGMINHILTNGDRQAAVDHVVKVLEGIAYGKYEMSNFVITKSLKSGYKNPGSLAHVVLAERIGARDPGKKPTVGDRMMYLAIESKTGREKDKLGERVETPEYILEHGLQIDYAYYIEKQIQTPVVQILELILNPKQVTRMINQFMAVIKHRRYGIRSLGKYEMYRPIVGIRKERDRRLLTASDIANRF